jgi:hypothetical protein
MMMEAVDHGATVYTGTQSEGYYYCYYPKLEKNY